MKTITATIQHLYQITSLFDQYMVFYGKESNIEKHKSFLKNRIKNNESTIYLAVNEIDEPVGFVQNYYCFSSVSLGKIVVLNDLFVDPKFRRQGIAEQLIRKTFDHADAIGAVRVDLGTEKTNTTAQKIYERIGFIKDKDFYNYSYSI